MRRKAIWIFFLITGVNEILDGCGPVEDANMGPLHAEITYQNDTNSRIEYFQLSETNNIFLFAIEPWDEYVVEVDSEFDTSGNLNPLNCCEGVFVDFQGRYSDILVIFDGIHCLTFVSGDGPTTQNLGGYASTVISDNSVRYTYVFASTDLAHAQPCN